jgi:hypothetical protein
LVTMGIPAMNLFKFAGILSLLQLLDVWKWSYSAETHPINLWNTCVAKHKHSWGKHLQKLILYIFRNLLPF